MVQDVTAALKREGRGHIGCHLPLEGLLPLPLPLEGCIPLSLEGLPLLPYRHPPLQIRSKLSDFFPTSEVLRPRIRGAVEPFIQQDSENKLLMRPKKNAAILAAVDSTQDSSAPVRIGEGEGMTEVLKELILEEFDGQVLGKAI
ncbi:hypothetical protein V8E54_009362 [Elaphomyces granulatus]